MQLLDVSGVLWSANSEMSGVGVFSALAVAMSSLFLAPIVSNENRELQRLSVEVANLRNMVEILCRDKQKAEGVSVPDRGADATPAART